MNTAGMLRVRNESRWIQRVLESLIPVCDRVFVLDDHSEDSTVEICESFGEFVQVIRSPFQGLDESRDKNLLLNTALAAGRWDWIIHVDGDERLEPGAGDKIAAAIRRRPDVPIWMWQVCYLWDRPDQWRTDGIYAGFVRPSMFRPVGENMYFPSTNYGGNLHCSNYPQGIAGGNLMEPANVRLLHYGYIDREMRVRKYEYYNRVDPNNEFEDRYRHIVQGDIPQIPAHARLKHAGPLQLEPFLA